MPYPTPNNYWPVNAGPQNAGMQFYVNLRRDINLVLGKDGQCFSFVNEMLPKPASEPFNIYKSAASSSVMFASTYQPYTSERTLLWGRMANNMLVSGMRWVPWYKGKRGCPEDQNVYPFREIFCPTVVYDIDSNVLHLWFWTNAINVGVATKYREIWDGKQVFIGTDMATQVKVLNRYDASKVLCYATGEFVSTKVTGGLVFYETSYQSGDEFYGGSMNGFSETAFDMVPLFCEPKLISLDYSKNDDVNIHGVQTTGLITDGIQSVYGGWGVRNVGGVQFAPWSHAFPAKVTASSSTTCSVDIYENGRDGQVTRSGVVDYAMMGLKLPLAGDWIMSFDNLVH